MACFKHSHLADPRDPRDPAGRKWGIAIATQHPKLLTKHRQWFGVAIFLSDLSQIDTSSIYSVALPRWPTSMILGRARLRCCTFGRGGSRLKLLTNATTLRQDLTSTFRIAPTLCFERSAAGSKDVLGPLGLRVGQYLGKAISQTAEVNKSKVQLWFFNVHMSSVQNPSIIPFNPGWLRTGFPSWTPIYNPQYIG